LAHCPATLPLLNFATVQADAVSLALENEEDGLSFEDICAGGFNEGLSSDKLGKGFLSGRAAPS
jgi:hypothetical protein